MANIQNGVITNPEMFDKLNEMWNTEEYADTKFLINNVEFHASSHLVSVMSTVLKAEMKTHFEHCGDREMRIGQIKNNESFSSILKFIYGMEINLNNMDRAVLCEVLSLSERFELIRFTAELKSYLSQLHCFQLDSVVVLLNTAKKFQLKDLYDKLTVFVFQNTSQLVKHESFVELQYDVLRDLLKADFFCTQEIDILMGTIHWHKHNINESSCKDNGNLIKEIQSTVVEERNVSSASSSNDNNTDVAGVESTDEPNGEVKKLFTNTAVMEESAHTSTNNIKENSTDGVVAIPVEEILKSFSEKVLKSLLLHIRVNQISVVDFMNALDLDVVKPNKDILLGYTSTSQGCEPRKKYITPLVNDQTEKKNVGSVVNNSVKATFMHYMPISLNLNCNIVHDIIKKFTVTIVSPHVRAVSNERYSIENLNWSVVITDDSKCANLTNNCHNRYSDRCNASGKTEIYLQCSSENETRWECTTEYQIRTISHNSQYPSQVLPESSAYALFLKSKFDNNNMKTNFFASNIDNRPRDWKAIYQPNGVYTVEVYFQYIHKTVTETKLRKYVEQQ